MLVCRLLLVSSSPSLKERRFARHYLAGAGHSSGHPEILDDVRIEQRPMMHDVPPGAGSVDARPRMDGDARWRRRQDRRSPTWDLERALSVPLGRGRSGTLSSEHFKDVEPAIQHRSKQQCSDHRAKDSLSTLVSLPRQSRRLSIKRYRHCA